MEETSSTKVKIVKGRWIDNTEKLNAYDLLLQFLDMAQSFEIEVYGFVMTLHNFLERNKKKLKRSSRKQFYNDMIEDIDFLINEKIRPNGLVALWEDGYYVVDCLFEQSDVIQ